MRGETDFEIRRAKPGDEPDIRALVGSVAMPGTVAVRFAREPDYFLGTTIMGEPCDVLLARHKPDGALAGIACRAETRAYLNGQESRLGYIGQIRVAPGFRGNWLVQRGAQLFKETSPAGLIYFGVIASENPRARSLLAGERVPGSLRVRRMCGITTCAIILWPRRGVRQGGIEIQPGSTGTLEEIVNFLKQQGPRRQFFPAYQLTDFTDGAKLRGLRSQDVIIARRNGVIAGVMAAWDQSAYKQDIVEAYGPALSRLRPIYDFAARLVGGQPLTPPGQAIPLVFAACIGVADDDPQVAMALISSCARSGRERGKSFLMIGLADNDPLLAVASKFFHVTYHSDLYAFAWSDDTLSRLDDRIPYIEIAAL